MTVTFRRDGKSPYPKILFQLPDGENRDDSVRRDWL
jgi:hypothetical protein